ncbi:TPA: DUF3304 domain-containing protein [Stenotrophomonas maltophilia]|uniref:DUF3304 domain-containing protein n=1 Tax=Stenotrophomonas maltophilia TaxID=40324 RepID=A0AAJ2JDL4_STEMA|nr:MULTISPECIES: DUF3304 domain-containing protein [Stenotrophomonas]MDQ7279500.1 DUF3304 domain-containing protein [Stenotrophomonas sp. Sm6012]MDT3469112.1 DUF3304 domain-containing protein [Stenotrophomonas maltophilia]
MPQGNSHDVPSRPMLQPQGHEKMIPRLLRTHLLATLVLLLLLPALAACKGQPASTPVGVRGYNHTGQSIAQFQVNGGSGGSARRHSAGGTVCCAVVPDRWTPDLKAEIEWTTNLETYQKAIVSIPRYNEVGSLAVHFLRNGQVKVFVTNLILGHPDYPLTGPEAPLREGGNPVWEHLRRPLES